MWPLGQVQQHHEPGGCARPGCRSPSRRGRAHDQVALPVPGHRPVLDLGGAFADVDHVRDPAPALGSALALRLAQRPAGAQVRGQLTSQRRRGPGRRATGRSSRATPTSPDRRGSPRRSRRAICSGLWCFRSRSCTSPRSSRLVASFAGLGRRAAVGLGLGDRRPVPGRSGPGGDPASSRLIVAGSRPTARAIARTPAGGVSGRSPPARRNPDAAICPAPPGWWHHTATLTKPPIRRWPRHASNPCGLRMRQPLHGSRPRTSTSTPTATVDAVTTTPHAIKVFAITP